MPRLRLTRRKFLAAALAATPFALAGDAFALEPGWVETRTVRLGPGKPAHRFVQLTDIHHKGDRAYLQSVVQQVNALSPEFVCFTGDLVEQKQHLDEALAILAGGIKSPLYGVPGNHDYNALDSFHVVAGKFAATGGAWLTDQTARVADGRINLIGLTCRHQPQARWFAPDAKNVVLMHFPTTVDLFHDLRADLLLAGHSHGGQVRLPFYGALFVPKGVGQYEKGLYTTPAGPLYVNPGIGWYKLAVRFNCRPEITVFEV